eukprot:gnl/Carplike_NY0171/1055_a1442_1181.p1 GENE.gnl/Carplike_NY0171/1055_a1442_1181~~gnl/Carplike_NY0171/1055_a1442_1181.p1  ORF type:complete len:266 (-),score=68.92 gnl/Carplike_NY0171/1055_a1442_1181:350-1147(-)
MDPFDDEFFTSPFGSFGSFGFGDSFFGRRGRRDHHRSQRAPRTQPHIEEVAEPGESHFDESRSHQGPTHVQEPGDDPFHHESHGGGTYYDDDYDTHRGHRDQGVFGHSMLDRMGFGMPSMFRSDFMSDFPSFDQIDPSRGDVYYSSSSSMATNSNGVTEMHHASTDSRTGKMTEKHGRKIGDRSIVTELSRDMRSGEERRERRLANVKEDEVDSFERDWRDTRGAFRSIGYDSAPSGHTRALGGPDGSSRADKPSSSRKGRKERK